MPSEKLLLINADDLGLTPGINAGIFEAHARGVVTSATLMVGFPAAEAAAQQLATHPELGVGLHVVLTGGRPISPPESVPSLVDHEGRLPRRPDVAAKGNQQKNLRDAKPAEVLLEVRAQLDRFRELTGRPPTHLDSHHHCHRLPAVCDALIRTAREDGGVPIRNNSPQIHARLEAAAVTTPDTFVDSFFGPGATWHTLRKVLGAIGVGVTEIMCHPGHVDDELRRRSTYSEERQAELEALTQPEAKQILEADGVRLVHFGNCWH